MNSFCFSGLFRVDEVAGKFLGDGGEGEVGLSQAAGLVDDVGEGFVVFQEGCSDFPQFGGVAGYAAGFRVGQAVYGAVAADAGDAAE